MIIEKISINSFGALRDMTLEFSETVNIIEGENESGKSTLAAFIKYMLYGFPGEGSPSALDERSKRLNWETKVAQGSMTVKAKGKRYLISRSTVLASSAPHRTYKEECSIIDLDSGTPAFGKMPAGEVFFGVDRELFENTAFVGQIGDARINEGSVKESIENILFSGSETLNTKRAMDKISDKMEVLLHTSGVGGTIYDISARQTELEEKLRASDEDNKKILAKEAELFEVREKRAAAVERQEKLTELETCYKNVMLIQNFDRLHELETEAEAKNEVYREFIAENTMLGFVPDEEYLAEIRLARRNVNDAYNGLVDAEGNYNKEKSAVGITNEIEGAIRLSEDMGGEDEVLTGATAHYKRGIQSLAGGILALAVGIIASVVALVNIGALAPNPLNSIPYGYAVAIVVISAIIGVLGLGAAGYLAYRAVYHRRGLDAIKEKLSTPTFDDLKAKLAVIAEAREKRDTLIRDTENARMGFENAKARFAGAKRVLTEIISRWGAAPDDDDDGDFLDEFEDKVSAFLSEKNRLFTEKETVDLTVKEIRRTLADKSEIDIRAQVSPLKRKALASIKQEEIIDGIAECRAQIAEQDKLSFDIENELAALKLRAKDPGELYAKIQLLDTRLDELRARHKAYYLAHKTLENAGERLRGEISPRLGEYSTKLMEIMTNRKYTDISVDGGLKVTFKTPDGEKKSVDFLSGGTQDLTYISVRMALIDMLYTENPPICFDESFAHQDNVRAHSMMKAIAHLSEEKYQSFIFTCRAREAALAKEMNCGAQSLKLSASSDI